MRRNLIYIVVLFVLVACEKDATWQHQDATCAETITTTRHRAMISLNWDKASGALLQDVQLEYALTADFSQAQEAQLKRIDGNWEVSLTRLEENRTYFVRYIVTPDFLATKREASTFETINPLPPTIVTSEATDITATTAMLHGEAKIDDNYEITERGFYYSLLKDTDYERKQVKCGSGEGRFDAKIEALRANATYYIVAYAVNKNGVAYGDTLQFNTLNPYQQ